MSWPTYKIIDFCEKIKNAKWDGCFAFYRNFPIAKVKGDSVMVVTNGICEFAPEIISNLILESYTLRNL